MISITRIGQSRLDSQNGTSGGASLTDSILAMLSQAGPTEEQRLLSTFSMFPGADSTLEDLLSRSLAQES